MQEDGPSQVADEMEACEKLLVHEKLERARYFAVSAENLAQLSHAACLANLGTKLIVDAKKGTILRLCDILSVAQASLIVQRNYRVHMSRLRIERKYMTQQTWLAISRALVRKASRYVAVVLNTNVQNMLQNAMMLQQETSQFRCNTKDLLMEMQANVKRPSREDWIRFCHRHGIPTSMGGAEANLRRCAGGKTEAAVGSKQATQLAEADGASSEASENKSISRRQSKSSEYLQGERPCKNEPKRRRPEPVISVWDPPPTPPEERRELEMRKAILWG